MEFYPALAGRHVRSGTRQSIPSSSIESWADVMWILPSMAWGQTKRPRSRRLVKRHAPPALPDRPSHQTILIKSPRRPLKTNKCPEYGSCSSWRSQSAARELNPLRISVTPAAIHTQLPAGRDNIKPAPEGYRSKLLRRKDRNHL